jgi:hypothetical protein
MEPFDGRASPRPAAEARRWTSEFKLQPEEIMALGNTPSILRKASAVVWYEVWMLRSAAQVLSSPLFGEGVATNAFLESFTVHARALVGFFFGGQIDPEDMVARDFFDPPSQWAGVRKKMPAALKPVGARVAKEVAHLSYARLSVTPEAKGWDVPAITAAIIDLAGKFGNSVDPELLALEWKHA